MIKTTLSSLLHGMWQGCWPTLLLDFHFIPSWVGHHFRFQWAFKYMWTKKDKHVFAQYFITNFLKNGTQLCSTYFTRAFFFFSKYYSQEKIPTGSFLQQLLMNNITSLVYCIIFPLEILGYFCPVWLKIYPMDLPQISCRREEKIAGKKADVKHARGSLSIRSLHIFRKQCYPLQPPSSNKQVNLNRSSCSNSNRFTQFSLCKLGLRRKGSIFHRTISKRNNTDAFST